MVLSCSKGHVACLEFRLHGRPPSTIVTGEGGGNANRLLGHTSCNESSVLTRLLIGGRNKAP